MSRPRLLNDVARCHDAECPMRGNCLRWIERNAWADWTPHQATFRESPDATECKDFRAAPEDLDAEIAGAQQRAKKRLLAWKSGRSEKT